MIDSNVTKLYATDFQINLSEIQMNIWVKISNAQI